MLPAPGKLDKATNTFDLVVKNFLSVQRVSASIEDISLLALWLFNNSNGRPRLQGVLLLSPFQI